MPEFDAENMEVVKNRIGTPTRVPMIMQKKHRECMRKCLNHSQGMYEADDFIHPFLLLKILFRYNRGQCSYPEYIRENNRGTYSYSKEFQKMRKSDNPIQQ